MAQGNDQRANFTHFGDDQRAGIIHVVGVTHMEKVAATVKVTNSGREFRAWNGFGTRVAGGSRFAMRVHFYIPFTLLRCIVNKLKHLKNMAKVIGICSMKSSVLPSLAFPLSNAMA